LGSTVEHTQELKQEPVRHLSVELISAKNTGLGKKWYCMVGRAWWKPWPGFRGQLRRDGIVSGVWQICNTSL